MTGLDLLLTGAGLAVFGTICGVTFAAPRHLDRTEWRDIFGVFPFAAGCILLAASVIVMALETIWWVIR